MMKLNGLYTEQFGRRFLMFFGLFHVYVFVLDCESVSEAAFYKSELIPGATKRACPSAPDHLVFMCMSVVPSRASQILDNVESTLDQTFAVDIIVSVSEVFAREFRESEEYALFEIVKTLANMSNRIHVAYGRDRGPSSKLLLPLRKLGYLPFIFVIVDDDQVYSSSMVCDLLTAAIHYPRRAISRSSRNLSRTCSNIGDYNSTVLYACNADGADSGSIVFDTDVLLGTSSYMVRASFFSAAIFRYRACHRSIRNAILLNDDIWISAHLRANEISVVTILSGVSLPSGYVTSCPEVRRRISGADGLWHVNDSVTHRAKALVGVLDILSPSCVFPTARCVFNSVS
jgi:hypothetical protein